MQKIHSFTKYHPVQDKDKDRLICQKCLCGRQDVQSADQATRIVGGKESVKNEFPWKVMWFLVHTEDIFLRIYIACKMSDVFFLV